MRSTQRTAKKASRIATAVFTGAMLLASCAITPIPDRIPIARHLREGTEAQKTNQVTPSTMISGMLNGCIGEAACEVQVMEGDMLFNAKFMPEKDGNLEAIVERVGDGGVTLKLGFSFFAEDTRYKRQRISYGEWTKIENTDLRIMVKGDTAGARILLNPVDAARP